MSGLAFSPWTGTVILKFSGIIRDPNFVLHSDMTSSDIWFVIREFLKLLFMKLSCIMMKFSSFDNIINIFYADLRYRLIWIKNSQELFGGKSSKRGVKGTYRNYQECTLSDITTIRYYQLLLDISSQILNFARQNFKGLTQKSGLINKVAEQLYIDSVNCKRTY